jgi:hypothetical protein
MAAVALLLSACNSEIVLPTDRVELAATCAVVSASEARSAIKDEETPLGFDRQSQIIHYALLAGASEPGFSRDNAKRVVQRMQVVQDRISGDDWKPLVAPCETAFPEANLSHAVTLPVDPAEAQLTCYALGDFMWRALSAYEETYSARLLQYNNMLESLRPIVEPDAKKPGPKTVSNSERMAKRSSALAVAAKLGPPSKVMDACMERFPADAKAKKNGTAQVS